MKLLCTVLCSLIFLFFYNCTATKEKKDSVLNANLEKAQVTLTSLYQSYDAPNNLLRETYPFDTNHKATYLASDDKAQPNEYSYLWPYSGTLSAVNALLESSGDIEYRNLLDNKVLPGLEEYFDKKRNPYGYASYINDAPESDRFYDDNVWLGIDFIDIYMMTDEPKYLEKAKLIWDFVASGIDDKLGGGIYWCEQKKESKNTCSNAPGAVFVAKLYIATGDSLYLNQAKTLYHWTKDKLQDSTDYLYYDNISLNGKVEKTKYPYNSGQMIQAASLLYKLTDDEMYLQDARNIAKSAHTHFFTGFTTPQGEQFRLLKQSDVWFIAVMLRGFIELYRLDDDNVYLNDFQKSIDYAWDNMRDENGLFNRDWTGVTKDEKKWLLTQAAMVEMYARLSDIK